VGDRGRDLSGSPAGPATGCYPCAGEGALDDLPDRERVWVGQHWRVAHAFATALPGWLVVVPRRHTTRIAEHTAEEAAELGSLLVAASHALESVTGCAKTYVAQFAEADGYSHVHFHVVPRPPELTPDRRGPAVFGYLAGPEDDWVGERERDELSRQLRAALGGALGRSG
jgi:diadenosine tetraphosphate (Ap4A) HIT family hydrolase